MISSPFAYLLPEDRIAQRPVHPQDEAKLLVIDRKSGVITDSVFKALPQFLFEEDTLVFNNTKVRAARLFGVLENSKKEIELFLEQDCQDDTWVCFGKPLKKLPSKTKIYFSEEFYAESIERVGERRIKVKFFSLSEKSVKEELRHFSLMPIPPYIRGGKADKEDEVDYQPIFAKSGNSIASPTASLHFTDALLEKLAAKKITNEYVTLELGASSIFALEGTPPASEVAHVEGETLFRLKKSKRVIGVGTTVVRALESCINQEGYRGETSLFIQPGFSFSWINCLITNFHQPGTTHLLLVEAFLGRELLEKAYSHALNNNYRFLSYGDGMLIV